MTARCETESRRSPAADMSTSESSTRHLVNGNSELFTKACEAANPLRGFPVVIGGQLAVARVVLLHQIEINVLHLPDVDIEIHITSCGSECFQSREQDFIFRPFRQLPGQTFESAFKCVAHTFGVQFDLGRL